MGKRKDLESFNDTCEEYSTWIIKYSSNTFGEPVFMVWYTDTNNYDIDSLLTFKTGEIFAVDSIQNLRRSILDQKDNLEIFDSLEPWINTSNDEDLVENLNIDIDSVLEIITKASLDTPTIERIVDFINLYGDYVLQDERNSGLKKYRENEAVKKIWEFFYESIFWPRYEGKKEFKMYRSSNPLSDLLDGILGMKMSFEERIKRV